MLAFEGNVMHLAVRDRLLLEHIDVLTALASVN